MARLITIILYGYWFTFWALNSLDKLLNGTDLGLFTWYGKDRTHQFIIYLERLGWTQDLYMPLMLYISVIEMLIALVFLWAILVIFHVQDPKHRKFQVSIKLPIILSLLCFIGFSIWDIVTGDRAELLEHETYLIALCTTYIISKWEITEKSKSL